MGDQTSEDFFDKLVDAGVDNSGLEARFFDGLADTSVKSFTKLRGEEVLTSSANDIDKLGKLRVEANGEQDHQVKTYSPLRFDDNEDDKAIREGADDIAGVSETSHLRSTYEDTDHITDIETINPRHGVKEVQWSEFDARASEISCPDFFNLIRENPTKTFNEVDDGFVVLPDNSMCTSFDLHGGMANQSVFESNSPIGGSNDQGDCSNFYSCPHKEESIHYDLSNPASVQDETTIEYWDNIYPGWRFDPNTGQWYQANYNDTTIKAEFETTVPEHQGNAYYLQQKTGVTLEHMNGESKTYQTMQEVDTKFPAHMIFDPQYPAWYYDTIKQEWRTLDSYVESTNNSTSHYQGNGMFNVTTDNSYKEKIMPCGEGEQVNSYSQHQGRVVYPSEENYYKQDMSMLQYTTNDVRSTQFSDGYMSNDIPIHYIKHGTCRSDLDNSSRFQQSYQSFENDNNLGEFQGYHNNVVGNKKSLHQLGNKDMELDQQCPITHFNGPQVINFTKQVQSTMKPPNDSNEWRLFNRRPQHALVVFGFGGKLIVMKDQTILETSSRNENQDSSGRVISVLHLMDVAMQKRDGGAIRFGGTNYVHILCHKSFPSPLISNNVGTKDLNRWIDDRITDCASMDNVNNAEVTKLLFSLLKIACQHHGRVRSTFGAESKESDNPDSAFAKLLNSEKTKRLKLSHCLNNMPSEGQTQATAEKVQKFLVSGRKKEALQCAEEGHLWGLAIVIATLLGDKFYGETITKMALHQLVAGSPLRTLCLLFAGKPAEVFSNSNFTSFQSGQSQSSKVLLNVILEDWEANLGILIANRTKGDELVITHLGDCLWRERCEVMAAHICYLVAEANIEPYSDTARLCLIGADHLKCSRTYATPEAIQRTELYEYAKVLGNSQFILLHFQPYKLIYACMLAEVGKLSDSLKYCQAVMKSLKTGRSSEVDTCRVMISSLEERIKVHQQSGYNTSLAPTKFVGRLLNFFDHTAHRVVGGLPPPIPSTSHYNDQRNEPRVSSSQSTMAMSSLMPHSTADDTTRKSRHNRSVSEPDIGRTPRKAESPEKSSSTSPHDSNAMSRSRFGRFGSQIFQKTVGLVLRSRVDRQAKLGDKNKFYYDEKLKRWVEEGVEPLTKEIAIAPPPATADFKYEFLSHENKDKPMMHMKQYSNGSLNFKNLESNDKIVQPPSISSLGNHLPVRGRTSIHARYVDTFNKCGGIQAKLLQPTEPLVPYATSNAKMFIPTPVPNGQESDSNQSSPETVIINEDTPVSSGRNSFSSPQMFTPPTMHQRHPSLERVSSREMGMMMKQNGSLPPHSRRTLSWSPGGYGETKTLGETLGFPFSSDFATIAEEAQQVQFMLLKLGCACRILVRMRVSSTPSLEFSDTGTVSKI